MLGVRDYNGAGAGEANGKGYALGQSARLQGPSTEIALLGQDLVSDNRQGLQANGQQGNANIPDRSLLLLKEELCLDSKRQP